MLMGTSELITMIISGVGGLLLLLLSVMIARLNKTIENLERQVQELKEYVAGQEVVNKQTEKLAYVIDKLQARVDEHDKLVSKIDAEHQMYHKKSRE